MLHLNRAAVAATRHLLSSAPLRHQLRPAAASLLARNASSWEFSDTTTLMDAWPVRQNNTVINVCPQGERMVVERLGKLLRIEEPGWFLAIPLIDKISYRIDMRERAIEITPQTSITKDNVSVDVSGNLYVQFVDPERAAYGNFNPLYAVRQHAQSSMRASIGELDLDEILHARAKLNQMITSALNDAAMNWGLQVKRYEITEITPDTQISKAMDKQAAAERARRERVLTAEGEKKAYTLKSEGVKLQLINESEGHLIKVQNEAKAAREKLVLEAEGEAQALVLRATAQAESIERIAAAIRADRGAEAAQLSVARDYIEMYGQMGAQSNTMLFSDRPADVNSLLAQAAVVMGAAGKVAASGNARLPPGGAVADGPGLLHAKTREP